MHSLSADAAAMPDRRRVCLRRAATRNRRRSRVADRGSGVDRCRRETASSAHASPETGSSRARAGGAGAAHERRCPCVSAQRRSEVGVLVAPDGRTGYGLLRLPAAWRHTRHCHLAHPAAQFTRTRPRLRRSMAGVPRWRSLTFLGAERDQHANALAFLRSRRAGVQQTAHPPVRSGHLIRRTDP